MHAGLEATIARESAMRLAVLGGHRAPSSPHSSVGARAIAALPLTLVATSAWIDRFRKSNPALSFA